MPFESSDGAHARNKDLKALDKGISASTSRQQGSRGSKPWNITEVDDTGYKQSKKCGGERNIKQKGLNRHKAVHKKNPEVQYGWRNQAGEAHKSSKMTQKMKEREVIIWFSARERCQQ